MGPSINTLIRNWLRAVAILRECFAEMPVEINLPSNIDGGKYEDTHAEIAIGMDLAKDQNISEEAFESLSCGAGNLIIAYNAIRNLQNQEKWSGQGPEIRGMVAPVYHGVNFSVENAEIILGSARDHILRDKGQRE